MGRAIALGLNFGPVRAPRWSRSWRDGAPRRILPTPPTPAGAFVSAARYDPQVLQWLFEVMSRCSLPGEVMGREGVRERSAEVAAANPPYRSPGPDRAQLEELLAELGHPDAITLTLAPPSAPAS